MTFGSLFAGIGGMDLGLERAGMQCAWQVEIDDYARRVLVKHWPGVRRWDDVRTFPPHGDWGVDLICGGFPCQDVSFAGNRAGLDGDRSGLWFEYARIIRTIRPSYVLVENTPGLVSLGLGRVLGDLANLGFDAEWSLLSACAMGAPHTRERLFIVAYSHEVGRRGFRFCSKRKHEVSPRQPQWETPSFNSRWENVVGWFKSLVPAGDGATDAAICRRVVDGIPDRLHRTGACGNAVVPQVAEWIGRRILEVKP